MFCVSTQCGRMQEGGGGGGQITYLPFPYPHMPTFDIPTGPPMTQKDTTYHIPGVTACCSKSGTTAWRGSLAYDCKKGGMTHEWNNEDDFWAWLAAEESSNSIELIVSQIRCSDSGAWQEWCLFWCSHEFMGGNVTYQCKNDWERKIPSKKTGCQCCLTIKLYLQSDTILGKYENEHDHTLGNDNL